MPSTTPSLDTSFPVLARVPATASVRPRRSNRSQTPPSPLSSQGNLTLASRRRRAPTYSLVVQLLAKLKLHTPLPRLRGQGFGPTQCACADCPVRLKKKRGWGRSPASIELDGGREGSLREKVRSDLDFKG